MKKFTEDKVNFTILCYPLFSNTELSNYIGCSINWLEKLAQKHELFKADYCFIPGQSGYPFDLTGYRFGEITVKYRMEHKEKNNTMWKCSCSCGREIRCRSSVLRKGNKIDCDYIVDLYNKQNGLCALSGVKIEFPRIVNNKKFGDASLDRIDSSLPYESGNIQWIHKDINQMKNKHEQQDFIQWCFKITDFQRNIST